MVGIHGVKTVFVVYGQVLQLGRTRRGGTEYAVTPESRESFVVGIASLGLAAFIPLTCREIPRF